MNRAIILYKKLRTWGIKGVWDYFVRKFFNIKTRAFFLANAKLHPLTPKYGITIVADFTLPTSLSKTVRDFAFALKKAGIPFQTFDLHPRTGLPVEDYDGIITPVKEFRVLKYTHIIEMFSSPLPKSLPLERMRIVFWEFTSGLMEYNPAIADVKTIIAMSDFNFEVFKKILPPEVSVRKILYPFFSYSKELPSIAATRRKYGIGENEFAVFFNFDYGSSFNRKNPDGSIKAFAKAFHDHKDARLVFKTKGASEHKKERENLWLLAKKLGISDRVTMIDDYIPMQDVYGLTNACDVYLSLHRGEGFGLGIVEAMSLGKPVIVTNYSSPKEFCKEGNTLLVAYKEVDVQESMRDHPCYISVKKWAEPDTDSAAAALSSLYNNKHIREKTGDSAKKFVTEYFSIDNFKKSIENLLAGK